jgi:thioesterase domain-containing protein
MAADRERPDLRRTLALRHVIFGGEALEPRRLVDWYERHADSAPVLVNMYGITETTVHVTYLPLEANDADRPGGSPIGVRIPDLQLHILDEQRQLVPVGVTGELYVGGAGLARGYLGQPALTAERFLVNPFPNGGRDGRLYKTGDLARRLPDGSVEYLGRNDFQVKIRGFRIELGEVEAVLARAPGVSEVVVLARADVPGARRLVAYFTASGTAATAPDARTLREHAARSLPDYMVPAAYVRLDALPVTPNGKLDRRALPAPDADASREVGYVAPRTRVELALTALWEDLLAVRPIGVRDDFFALGGHSLLAVKLVARIEASFGQRVPLVQLLAGATVEAIAAALHMPAASASPLVQLTGGAAPPVVCVHAIGGSALSYRALADALGPGQPVFAFHARGLDDDAAPRDDVDAIASAYLEALDGAARPWLLGWSFGALVAHAMACALERADRPPRGLILVEPAWPAGAANPDDDTAEAMLADELGLPAGERSALLALPADQRLAQLAQAAVRGGALPEAVALATLTRTGGVYQAHRRAHARHRPGRFGGRTLVVRAAQQPDVARARLAVDPSGGWAGFLVRAPELHRLDGDHFSLLRPPHVTALAQLLTQTLRENPHDRV